MATVQLRNIKKIYPIMRGETGALKKKKKRADDEAPPEKKVNLRITDEGVVAV